MRVTVLNLGLGAGRHPVHRMLGPPYDEQILQT